MNNYHIYDVVGQGKYSVVYKGRVKKSIKYVAVKSVERSRRRKLMNEVRIFHDLNHKNILKFHNWYETRNHLWIIFEYCAGGDLYQLIETDKKLPEDTVRRFAFELVEGLSYLHSNGIIYSDLKPSNILLNEYGVLKFSDFGLSKKIEDMIKPEAGADASKPKAGTPYYMAPELFQDNGVHSFYSDFWSLGCLMYEMATGKPPYCTNSLKDLITMILEADFKRVDGCSMEFNDLVSKLLQKDPINRINWDELKGHPFWQMQAGKPLEFTKRIYPEQIQFNMYLKSRGIDPTQFFMQRANPIARKPQGPSGRVDIMRLSYNVMKNIKKEEDDLNNRPQQRQDSNNDVEDFPLRVKGLGEDQSTKLNQQQKIQNQVQVTNNDLNIRDTKVVLNFSDKDNEDDQNDYYPGPNQEGAGSITPHNQDSNSRSQSNNDLKFAQQTQKIETKSAMQQPQVNEKPYQIEKTVSQPPQPKPGVTGINFTYKQEKPSPMMQAQQCQKDLVSMINMQLYNQPQANQSPATMSTASSNANSQQSLQQNAASKIPHKSIDQLLMHNSDTAVKPIIGNKEIEKQVDAVYDPQYLNFEPWSAEHILQQIDSPEIESHLNDLYNSIAQNTSINEKNNALLYFESIIINSNVSNRLINSAFMNLLVKMMKTVKTPQIRIRLCSVIGLLIRHSTVIENELAESDIEAQLIEIMKDRNAQVRKKAIAALGEYMFYAATQLDDEQADSCWEISNDAIDMIVCSLTENEDEIVRFYACKTLENITAQSVSAGDRFASDNSVKFLLEIFLTPISPDGSSVNENLRTSSAVALSHLCKLKPQLFPLIFSRITPKIFCKTLIDGQSRVQQAFITMLNQALHLKTYPKLNEVLLNEELFLQSLMRLLEHHSIVIRGKVLLTFLLLFKQDFRWMAIVDPEVKFFHVLDRLTRDNYKYVQCCLLCLVDGIVEIMPFVFQAISEELNILLNGGRTATIPSEFDRKINRSEFEHLQGNLIYIAIILDLQQAQIVKNRITNYAFIRSIATLIDNCDTYSFQGAEEFLNALLLITEGMSSNQKILLQMNEPIINFMLHILLAKIGSESADIRFLSLKIFTDIIIQYLNDDSIYDPKGQSIQVSENGNSIKVTTQQINDIFMKQLFPNFGIILRDTDPTPLFGLKLLSAIVERNQSYIPLVKKYDLFLLIAENYQINHPRLNRHTINILKSMIEGKQLTFQELFQHRIVEKTTQIVKNMLSNKQDWCIELLLDIIHEILSQFNEVVKTRENEISKLIEEIFNNFDFCVTLLSSQYEIQIIEKASQCLIQMLQLYALCQTKRREIYFVEQHMTFLVKALQTDKKIIQKRVLKCIYWALIQSEYQIMMRQDQRSQLDRIIRSLLQNEDKSIANTSLEIYKILQEQNAQNGYDGMSGQGNNQLNFYHNAGGNIRS